MSSIAQPLMSERNDFLDTTALWFATKPFAVAKAMCVAIDVIKEMDWIPEGCEKGFSGAKRQINLVKLARAPGEFFANTNKARHATSNFFEKPSTERFLKVMREALGCIGPIWDGVEFLTKAIVYLPKNAPWVQNLNGINGLAIVISMTWSAWDNLKMACESTYTVMKPGAEKVKEAHKLIDALLDLIRTVATVAIGAFLFIVVFYGTPIFTQAQLTALAVVTVVTGILSFYHKNYNELRAKG